MLHGQGPGCGILVLAALSSGLAGCGTADELDRIPLVRVKGTVTLDWIPLQGARLTFVPEPSNLQITAGSGATDSEGRYMALFRGRRGLAAGKYLILIDAPARTSPSVPAASGPDEPDPYQETAAGQGRPSPPG